MTENKTYPVIVLLVDDQPIIAEAIKRMVEGQSDITFHYCSDPTKAIKLANQISPTVILQDLVMPDIDGLQLVKYFRANPATAQVPLIVLSTKEEPAIKAEAFALGANDYMVKLPDRLEVLARIKYHSEGYIRLLERNEAYKKLAESKKILQDELNEAATYVTRMLPKPLKTPEVNVTWRFIPSNQLGGDIFGYRWIDEDHFSMYLLDVCGHGVGAALLSVTVMNVLSSKSLPNTDFLDPSQVLSALNEQFPMEKHNDMFFTMWYGVFNKKTRRLIYGSGGHPPAILFTGPNRKQVAKEELSTPGLVIGGMAGVPFQSAACTLGKFAKLYLYSDGVYEIAKADGSTMPLTEFVDMLSEYKEDGDKDLDRIQGFAQKLNGPGGFADDFSIVEFTF